MLDTSSAKKRGCGFRQKGGIYLECDVAEKGMPPSQYLLCPPLEVDVEALGLSQIGVRLIEVGGTVHVFDWVGSTHYPNVEDYLAEFRVHGVSRRISKREDFSRLSRDSRLILLHSRAIIRNAAELRDSLVEGVRWPCPVHGFDEGMQRDATCHCLYREVVEGGVQAEFGQVEREIGDVTYRAHAPGIEVEYQVGAFASIPIGRIAVIRDDEGDSHLSALGALSGVELPVRLEDQ